MMQTPQLCDTFVVLPYFTTDGKVVFGKNSNRPRGEVQEVVYVKGGIRPSELKCTYLTIEEHPSEINSVILSKPAWMWGAEMGSNDKNVSIGNEAVWTKYNEDDGDGRVKRLLGMDLVRLGLERGKTAEEALDTITSLLERYGQGGPCAELDENLSYHNSFLIADPKQAWVLETSGNFWVAEQVLSYRNISNGLTICTIFQKHSADIQEKTKKLGLWDGEGLFNFSMIFEAGGDLERLNEGQRLLYDGIYNHQFTVDKMMMLLRRKEHRICRGVDDIFPTQGSQVSWLSNTISVHYFTATPDTSMSYFKPFVFTPNAAISEHTISSDEPLREHYLYKIYHEEIIKKNDAFLAHQMYNMERHCIADLKVRIEKIEQGITDISVLDNLMKECVDAEITQYTLANDMANFSI